MMAGVGSTEPWLQSHGHLASPTKVIDREGRPWNPNVAEDSKQAEAPSNVKVRNVSGSPSLMSYEPSKPSSWGILLSSQSSEPTYQASWPLPVRKENTSRRLRARHV